MMVAISRAVNINGGTLYPSIIPYPLCSSHVTGTFNSDSTLKSRNTVLRLTPNSLAISSTVSLRFDSCSNRINFILLSELFSLLIPRAALVTDFIICLTYFATRSDEHTSELQPRDQLVCRLRLE